jgi:hypothetical protein
VSRKGSIFIGALLGAIAGAFLSGYAQKVWAAEQVDEVDFGQRLARLETEIEELELQQRERRRTARGKEGGTWLNERNTAKTIRAITPPS